VPLWLGELEGERERVTEEEALRVAREAVLEGESVLH